MFADVLNDDGRDRKERNRGCQDAAEARAPGISLSLFRSTTFLRKAIVRGFEIWALVRSIL